MYFDHTGPCTDPARHCNCPGRWRGAISLGFGPDGKRIRRKVSGTTRANVADRLAKLHAELDASSKAAPSNYTLSTAAEDWLAHGLPGRSPKTIRKNKDVLEPILAAVSAARLRDLSAADVDTALAHMSRTYSTAAVRMGPSPSSARSAAPRPAAPSPSTSPNSPAPGQRMNAYYAQPATPDYDAMILLDLAAHHPPPNIPAGQTR